MHKGSCICGKVRFEVEGDLSPPHACHCSICRKGSGFFGAGADIPRESLKIEGEEHVTWFQSSDWARRGFCSHCGSNLFFDPIDKSIPWTGVSMGAFDTKTRVQVKEHIFVKDKGDYYELSDGLPQNSVYPGHKDNIVS
ncbi:MAG: GFA family protein [Pseudomonadota bacterium]